ncbi:mitochondrial proton/calcium exchanger protein isoform X2 [Atheta coriaria]|uniref:mitochondrial proton/calcium exchanger protein isoform X2 n=1 Tax=Dalotia coriaria TaxID=877792 RepID=UPI0031F45739
MQVFLRSPNLRNGHYGIIKKCSLHCNVITCPSLNKSFEFNKEHPASKSNTLSRPQPLLSFLLRPNTLPLSVRHISTTPIRYDEPLKPSSKVEATVKAIKEKAEKEAAAVPAETPPKAVVKKSIKDKVLDELRHYYHGFRLLFIDIRISYGLLWRVLNGNTLTRREYRLLMRTVGDMFRLVPFSVFLIVPFMEFLLPFFIKFFPGMLPSTFQSATEKEDKLKQSLKVKLEMAKFLQQTLDDMSVQHKDHNSQQAKEFSEWFNKVRTSGEQVSNEEILKFSKLFQDEITLDSLSRNQLVALCRVLEVQTLGTNNLLRFQLRMKLRSLAADDKMIQKEGVDSLSLWEVQQACRARGMRAFGVTEARLRAQLQDWLDLSLNEKVPPSLLLLSRALMLPETIPTSDKLKATISALPDTIVTQTKHAIGESEGKIDNKVQLEVIMEEARKIKEERKELGEDILAIAERQIREKELLKDTAPILTDESGVKDPHVAQHSTVKESHTPPPKLEVLHTKDVEALEDALDAISKEKKPIVEKAEIEELKEQMADYTEDVQDLKKAALPDIKETKAAKRLFNRVTKMISGMDEVLRELEKKEAKLKKDMDVAKGAKEEELLKIDEIMAAIKKIQKVPDDSRLKQIETVLSKIDVDRDGSIKVEDVLKVIEIIGKENVQLSSKQVDELLELLDKEEILEVEDKIEKALKREIEAKMSAVAHPDAGVVPPPSVATPTTTTPSDSTTSTTTAAPKADETKKTSTADPNDASKKGRDPR